MNRPLYHTEQEIVVCDLCFRHCRIRDGSTGFCGVNQNDNGTLQSLVYGFPEACHIDPIEKKPLFHFYPGSSIYSIGTAGCNFRCPFCQNWSLSFKHPERINQISNQQLIQEIQNSKCTQVAFTYNEPTVSWLWYRDLATIAKASGIRTVMVTNGAMSREVCDEMVELIDAVNVDIKCGSEHVYESTLHGNRAMILENLATLSRNNIWIELTTLVVPRLNDSLEEISDSMQNISDTMGTNVPWHISAYHPAFRYSEPATATTTIAAIADHLRDSGFHYIYEGNTPRPQNTLCTQCNTLLIERSGYHSRVFLKNGNCPTCGRALEGRFV